MTRALTPNGRSHRAGRVGRRLPGDRLLGGLRHEAPYLLASEASEPVGPPERGQGGQRPGVPRPGFIAPLLTSLAQHDPQTFTDITQGTNALFGGACCPARPGFDLATGWGSPVADVIASALPR